MAKNNDKTKPVLKNLDDLFDSMAAKPVYKYVVISAAINGLTPFSENPFHLYEGERLDDMVESIRKNGVLVPVIVRRIGEILEILSGHNRVNASSLAGFSEVPVIVMENISDDEALMYVVETNLIQRSFADMAHSEKAAVIALYHSKMFSQGKRNDILLQLKMLENPHGNNGNETLSQKETKLRTDEKIGKLYNLSRNTIARYLRIQKLIPALKKLLDKDGIAFTQAVTLSFLKETEQSLLYDCTQKHGFKINTNKAGLLRQFSEKSKLSEDYIHGILSGEMTKKKSSRTPSVKISKPVCAKYFTPEQSVKEIQSIIEKALEMYYNRQDNK